MIYCFWNVKLSWWIWICINWSRTIFSEINSMAIINLLCEIFMRFEFAFLVLLGEPSVPPLINFWLQEYNCSYLDGKNRGSLNTYMGLTYTRYDTSWFNPLGFWVCTLHCSSTLRCTHVTSIFSKSMKSSYEDANFPLLFQ